MRLAELFGRGPSALPTFGIATVSYEPPDPYNAMAPTMFRSYSVTADNHFRRLECHTSKNRKMTNSFPSASVVDAADPQKPRVLPLRSMQGNGLE
jgi:hypothetical protein